MSDSEEVIPEKKGRGRPPAAEKADKVKYFLSNFKTCFCYRFLVFHRNAKRTQKKVIHRQRLRKVVEGQKVRQKRAHRKKPNQNPKLLVRRKRSRALKKRRVKTLQLKPKEYDSVPKNTVPQIPKQNSKPIFFVLSTVQKSRIENK
jgi:hypothetical protein